MPDQDPLAVLAPWHRTEQGRALSRARLRWRSGGPDGHTTCSQPPQSRGASLAWCCTAGGRSVPVSTA
jgi:hypothetical protein